MSRSTARLVPPRRTALALALALVPGLTGCGLFDGLSKELSAGLAQGLAAGGTQVVRAAGGEARTVLGDTSAALAAGAEATSVRLRETRGALANESVPFADGSGPAVTAPDAD